MASFLDVCRFVPTAGGTTDWTYSSAVQGYQSPSAAGAVNGTVYRYRAESADLSQWEIGYGAYNSSTGVFARTTVLFNSLGTTAKVSFSAVPQVAIVAIAEDLPSLTAPNTFTNTLSITPAANSYGEGLQITQSSPTSGSVAGPISFNEIDLNYQGAVTGSTQVAALRVNVNTGGANLSGGPVMGGYFNMQDSIAGSTAALDKIGLVGSFLGIINDSAGGGGYGLNAYAGVTATGSINRLVGLEADIEIRSGGSATYRYAISAVNESLGVGQASTLDSAIVIGNIGNVTGAFLNGLTLTKSLGQAPLATTANWFNVDAAMTIANVLNLTNLTVTGNIVSHANLTITGAGAATFAGNVIMNAALTNTVNDSTNSHQLVARSGTSTVVGVGSVLTIVDSGSSTFTGSVLSTSPSGGVGYAAGAGGSVTQASSKANGVTLNKTSGAITMNSAALAASTTVVFILTNSSIAATDTVSVAIQSGNVTNGTYQVWSEKAASGQVDICVRNISAGSLSEALVLQFNVIKGADS